MSIETGGVAMGTILKNSEWESRTEVKKGNVGESCVKKFLEEKGFVCYQPTTDNAHAFDMLAIKNKQTAIIAEVKSKELLNKWKATGFPQRNFLEYERFYKKYGIKIFMFFVDHKRGEIYGNWLMENLEAPRVEDGIQFPRVEYFANGKDKSKKIPTRLYHFNSMRPIAKLDETQIQELKALTQRSYAYRND